MSLYRAVLPELHRLPEQRPRRSHTGVSAMGADDFECLCLPLRDSSRPWGCPCSFVDLGRTRRIPLASRDAPRHSLLTACTQFRYFHCPLPSKRWCPSRPSCPSREARPTRPIYPPTRVLAGRGSRRGGSTAAPFGFRASSFVRVVRAYDRWSCTGTTRPRRIGPGRSAPAASCFTLVRRARLLGQSFAVPGDDQCRQWFVPVRAPHRACAASSLQACASRVAAPRVAGTALPPCCAAARPPAVFSLCCPVSCTVPAPSARERAVP